VEEVAQVDPVPLSGSRHGTMVILEGKTERHQISNTNVSSSYFRLLGIPMVRGRAFDEREQQSEAKVVVISESAARHFWPGEDPVGKRLRIGDNSGVTEVVGVAKDVRSIGLSKTDGDFLYFPLSARGQLGAKVMVRGKGGTASLENTISKEARGLDSNILVHTGNLENNLILYRLPTKILSILAMALGVAGLLLASLGIYGVMAYAVTQRTREIGIRMTLGAGRREVLWLVLRQSLRPVAIGIGLGLCGCAAVSQVLSSLLFGVSPLDPWVYGGVSLFLAGIAMLASYLPARRATRVDPMSALRYQ
jgi:putative ABC transport system permease protein